MSAKAKIIVRDNGYFQIWQKPDGARVRVSTENTQYARRYRRGERARLDAITRERLSQ